MLSILSGCGEKDIIIGQWVYDRDRIIMELKGTDDVPEKLLHCFEIKACGNDTIFEHTGNQYRQITIGDNGRSFIGEFVDYTITNKTDKSFTLLSEINGEVISVNFNIININYLSYDLELDGFKWTEYWQRKH